MDAGQVNASAIKLVGVDIPQKEGISTAGRVSPRLQRQQHHPRGGGGDQPHGGGGSDHRVNVNMATAVGSLETYHTWLAGLNAFGNNRTESKQVGILFLLLFTITHRAEVIVKASRQVNASAIRLMQWQEVRAVEGYTDRTTSNLMEEGYNELGQVAGRFEAYISSYSIIHRSSQVSFESCAVV